MVMVARKPAFTGLVVASLVAFACGPAEAHGIGDGAAGILAGVAHPLSGWDHAVAMIGVGIWATQSGRAARWSLPASFLAAMATGGVLGGIGFALPAVEIGIALSVLALGIAIVTAARPVAWLGMALVAAFAVFHGHAHGAELPAGVPGALYGAGALLATAALHAAGLGLGGLAARLGGGHVAPRALGAVISAAGLLLIAA
jgi:urease accessory protein